MASIEARNTHVSDPKPIRREELSSLEKGQEKKKTIRVTLSLDDPGNYSGKCLLNLAFSTNVPLSMPLDAVLSDLIGRTVHQVLGRSSFAEDLRKLTLLDLYPQSSSASEPKPLSPSDSEGT